MDSVTKTAKTVEEAIQQALEELQITRDEADIAVLEVTGRSGVFGILGHPSATVRVSRKEKPAARPAAAESMESLHEEKPAEEPPAIGETQVVVAKDQRTDEVDVRDSIEVPLAEPQDKELAPSVPAMSEHASKARALVEEILSKMKLDGEVVVTREDDRAIHIDIRNVDQGILIGKHGQHLAALQYLVNVILGKDGAKHRKVVLDSGNYRDRREQALRELALSSAEKVKRQGVLVRLRRLRADERRIIHIALEKDRGVQTFSEGQEPDRTIVIAPARQNPRRRE